MKEEKISVTAATTEDIQRCEAIDQDSKFPIEHNVYLDAVKDRRVLVAKIAGKIIGHLRFTWLWDNKLPYVQLLRVHKEYQRQGIGKALIARLEEMLRESKATHLLSSTEETNDTSIMFHESLGFIRCGELDVNEDGQPEIFFKKKLS